MAATSASTRPDCTPVLAGCPLQQTLPRNMSSMMGPLRQVEALAADAEAARQYGWRIREAARCTVRHTAFPRARSCTCCVLLASHSGRARRASTRLHWCPDGPKLAALPSQVSTQWQAFLRAPQKLTDSHMIGRSEQLRPCRPLNAPEGLPLPSPAGGDCAAACTATKPDSKSCAAKRR